MKSNIINLFVVICTALATTTNAYASHECEATENSVKCKGHDNGTGALSHLELGAGGLIFLRTVATVVAAPVLIVGGLLLSFPGETDASSTLSLAVPPVIRKSLT